MNPAREVFLQTGRQVADLLSHPEVERRWCRSSVLERMTVGALAGHLSRSLLQVEAYLDGPVSDAEPMDAPAYYLRLADPTDLDSTLNTAIRQRAEQSSAAGPAAMRAAVESCLAHLADRLPAEPRDRLIEAFGAVLPLDSYLETRLVEMTVHHDDLRVSIGADTADLPAMALDRAIAVLVETAVRRHGRRAVLVALTRRERDEIGALRVI